MRVNGDTTVEMVIPALNEQGRLGPTIDVLSRQLASLDNSGKIVLVDNGSVDSTAAFADHAYYDVPIKVVGCRERGKGAAVRAGILETSAPYIGYCDADLSTPPDTLHAALSLLENGADVVVGSRRAPGAAYVVAQPFHRRVGGYVFRKLSKRMVGPLTDTQCGFKMFNGTVGRQLFEATHASGFAFDVEVLSLAIDSGHKVVELPVAWADQSGSTLRPVTDGFATMRELRMLRRRHARRQMNSHSR